LTDQTKISMLVKETSGILKTLA